MRPAATIALACLTLTAAGSACRDFSVSTDSDAESRMTDAVEVKTGVPFQLPFGQEARLYERGITIRFEEVVSDTRCSPADQCTLPGSARILIALKRDSGKLGEYVLAIPGAVDQYYYYGDRVLSGNESIRMLRLEPYPQPGDATEPESYRAFLRVDAF